MLETVRSIRSREERVAVKLGVPWAPSLTQLPTSWSTCGAVLLRYVKLHFVATPLEKGGGVNALPNKVNSSLQLHQHCNLCIISLNFAEGKAQYM